MKSRKSKIENRQSEALGSDRPVAYVISPAAASAMDRLVLQVEVLAKKVAALEKLVFSKGNGATLLPHVDPEIVRKKELVDQIIFAVAQSHRLTRKDIFSNVRTPDFVWPRQLAMYLARKHTGLPITTLGLLFHRDHGTVLWGCGAVEDRIATDRNAAEEVAGWDANISLIVSQQTNGKESHL